MSYYQKTYQFLIQEACRNDHSNEETHVETVLRVNPSIEGLYTTTIKIWIRLSNYLIGSYNIIYCLPKNNFFTVFYYNKKYNNIS